MALLNFKYGNGTPAAYEQGTIYVSGDNKKIYVGDPTSTSGAGFCVGDFIEVAVAASGKQEEVLGAITAPQQNVLYLTNNVTDGYDLWKYTGSNFVNLTKTGSILKLISDLTDVVTGINTNLNNYSTTTQMNSAISSAISTAKTEILGEDYTGTLKEVAATAAQGVADAKAADDKAVQAGEDAAAAQSTADTALANAATADGKAVEAKGAADAAQEDATAALNALGDVTDVAGALEDLKEEILGDGNTGNTIAAALAAAEAAQSAADAAQKAADDAQKDADQGIADAKAAQKTADEAIAMLDGITDTVVTYVQGFETTLRGGYTGSLNDLSTAAGRAQTAAEAAQEDATQGLKDAAAAQKAADDAQADATEALTALGTVTDVAGAIATAKSEILGGSTSTLKAAEDAIAGLDSEIEGLIEDIDNLSNIMNFIGVTESELKDGENSTPVIANNADYAPKAGDVVVSGATEFVYDGSKWQLIGNTSAETAKLENHEGRIENLEESVEDHETRLSTAEGTIVTQGNTLEDHENRLKAAEGQLTWGSF